MKGESAFKEKVASEIRSLLRSKEKAEREDQKHLRGQLRKNCCFYISDFPDTPRPFRAKDFDQLITEGRIRILR